MSRQLSCDLVESSDWQLVEKNSLTNLQYEDPLPFVKWILQEKNILLECKSLLFVWEQIPGLKMQSRWCYMSDKVS